MPQLSNFTMPVEGKDSKTVRVAVYVLLSEGVSDEADLSHYVEFFSSVQGCSLTDIYYDYDTLAGGIRTNYERLLSDCSLNKIDRIVCRSVSDFASDTAGFLAALRFLGECNVSVWFEEEELDTALWANADTLAGLEVFQKEEKRSRGEIRRRVIRKRRSSGVGPNHVIYGYRYADGEDAFETTKDGYSCRKLVIVEEEEKVVRRIFRLVAEGVPFADVAKALNAEGVPAPKRRRRRIGTGAGSGALKEDLYTGWTAQRIRQMINLERYKEDAIVGGELFDAAHAAVSARRRGLAARTGEYDGSDAIAEAGEDDGAENEFDKPPVFSGKIICGECGRFFHVINRRIRPVWVCPSTRLNNGLVVCTAESVSEETVVRVVKTALAEKFGVSCEDGQDGQEDDRDGQNGFIPRIASLLEEYQGFEYREQSGIRSQIQGIREKAEALKDAARITQMRIDAQAVRLEVLGEEDFKEESLAALKEALEENGKELDGLAARESALLELADQKKTYWEGLARSAAARRETYQWLCALDGWEAFWNGLNNERLSSLMISVTVCKRQFTILWFDSAKTEIKMSDQVPAGSLK
ncbi:MAG: recombinase family protein [Lachnospiraceae bacterium]|nr:recombinase family protein [Lachnospiraceae bacterium]